MRRTGLTRDGTFLVEGGERTRAVRNLRFTDSILEALGRVDGVGNRGRVESDPRQTMMRDADVRGMTLFNVSDADLAEGSLFPRVYELRRVTPQDVRRVANRYVTGIRFAYVGDPSRVSADRLRAF